MLSKSIVIKITGSNKDYYIKYIKRKGILLYFKVIPKWCTMGKKTFVLYFKNYGVDKAKRSGIVALYMKELDEIKKIEGNFLQ